MPEQLLHADELDVDLRPVAAVLDHVQGHKLHLERCNERVQVIDAEGEQRLFAEEHAACGLSQRSAQIEQCLLAPVQKHAQRRPHQVHQVAPVFLLLEVLTLRSIKGRSS